MTNNVHEGNAAAGQVAIDLKSEAEQAGDRARANLDGVGLGSIMGAGCAKVPPVSEVLISRARGGFLVAVDVIRGASYGVKTDMHVAKTLEEALQLAKELFEAKTSLLKDGQ